MNLIKQYWKKEYILIVVAVLCVVVYYYKDELNPNKLTEYLPIFGGLAFGLNTLVQIAQ